MQKLAEPPDAVPVSDPRAVSLYEANDEPRDVVALLHELDQYLFAARLAAEAVRTQRVAHSDEADAILHFMLLQLDAAADRLRAFLLRDTHA